MKETSTQRQPTMLLVFKLNFQVHCKSVLKNVNKIVALLRKPQNIPPRLALVTIYICFVRNYVNDGDIIYDQALAVHFTRKLNAYNINQF